MTQASTAYREAEGYPVIEASGGSVAVAAGCREAAEAALLCARAGGNVFDAAICGAAVQCVAMPESTSLGGDLFAMVRHGGRTVALNASGPAPRGATVGAFAERGRRAIPATGPLSVQTPGLVAGIVRLHEHGASKPLAELLEPAIALAGGGCRVSARLAAALRAVPEEHALDGVWRQTFWAGGAPLREGDLLKQPGIADCLRAIASGGAAAFYRGAIARDIVDTLTAMGGLLGMEDLDAARAHFLQPLAIDFGRYRVQTQPPVSQGFVLLRALRLLGWRPRSELWPDAICALRQAFKERLEILGDDPAARDRATSLLEAEPAPDLDVRDDRPFAKAGEDTTTLSVANSDGEAIALIQSIYGDLGSCVLTRGTGILLNNRLSAFFLSDGHANRLGPGRSTMHTLHSFIVEDETGLRWAGGTPGGDQQPQINLQVLLRLLLLDESPTVALASPRWTTLPGTKPGEAHVSEMTLQYERGVGQDVVAAMAARSWRTSEAKAPIGSSKLVGLGGDGSVRGWADTRRHGVARAY